jgi:undecaprenyl-diphosphatase
LKIVPEYRGKLEVHGKALHSAGEHFFFGRKSVESKLKSSSAVPIVALAAAATLITALSLWRAQAFAELLLPAVNALDDRAILFLNRFAHRSWTLDTLFYLIDSNPLATAPLLMAIWWAWFKDKDKEAQTETREILLYGIIGSFVLLPLVRSLVTALPYRARPLHNPELHFQLTYNMDPNRLLGWSSFPSDHAVLWFLLATTVWNVSRRLGAFVFAYICVTLCIARIYLGVHYPSDVLVGGLIGIGAGRLCKISAIRKTFTRQPLNWLQRAPGAFYAGFFIVTSQMMEGFSWLHEFEIFLQATGRAILKLI